MDSEHKIGPKETRERILEATAQEMATSGLTGVRIEAVAARAECNKALIYRYFHDRETLFVEAFRHQLAKRLSVLGSLPEGLGPILHHWTEQTLQDRTFMHLILRESMEYAGDEPVEIDARQRYYETQISMLRQMQEKGIIDQEFDLEMLFMALLALISLPSTLPQIVYLATGLQPQSPEFIERWNGLLTMLAEKLKE